MLLMRLYTAIVHSWKEARYCLLAKCTHPVLAILLLKYGNGSVPVTIRGHIRKFSVALLEN